MGVDPSEQRVSSNPDSRGNPVHTPLDELPLYVDLDGTLVATDTLWESLWLLARLAPARLARLFLPLSRGRAAFKAAVARHATPDPKLLPYRPEVLAVVREARVPLHTLAKRF